MKGRQQGEVAEREALLSTTIEVSAYAACIHTMCMLITSTCVYLLSLLKETVCYEYLVSKHVMTPKVTFRLSSEDCHATVAVHAHKTSRWTTSTAYITFEIDTHVTLSSVLFSTKPSLRVPARVSDTCESTVQTTLQSLGSLQNF